MLNFFSTIGNILYIMLIEADFMRSIGKIYVVTAVCLTVWLGIAWYLLKIEQRLKKLEDQMK
jgi:CcmD family protein